MVQSVPQPAKTIYIYARFAVFLFPSLVVLFFSRVFLVPKLREIWERADREGPAIDAMLHITEGVSTYLGLAVLVLTGGFALLEFHVKSWQRVRVVVLDVLILLLHLVVLVGLLSMAVSAMAVVPLEQVRQ